MRFFPRSLQFNEHSCTPISNLDFKKQTHLKIIRDYASIYFKFFNCHERVKFLRVCLENDVIPNFLIFRVPENGVFSNQAVFSFHIKSRLTSQGQLKKTSKSN